MEKNFYTQLEEKVQQNLKKIKQTDPFLYKEMRIIYEMLKDAEYPTSKGLVQGPLARVTEEQAIALVAEFLEKCNPRYKDNLLKVHHIGIFYKVTKYKNNIKKNITIDKINDDSLGADFYDINKLSKNNLSAIAIIVLEKLGYNIKS